MKISWNLIESIMSIIIILGFINTMIQQFYVPTRIFLIPDEKQKVVALLAEKVKTDHFYDTNFVCLDYSKDLVNRLRKAGIQAEIFTYEVKDDYKEYNYCCKNFPEGGFVCQDEITLSDKNGYDCELKELNEPLFHAIVYVKDSNVYIEPQDGTIYKSICDFYQSISVLNKRKPKMVDC